MRFAAQQDYNTILGINKELVNKVVDTPVILYKVVITETPTNIYGEGTKKTNYTGVAIPCLIDLKNTRQDNKIGTLDIEQNVSFAFLVQELKDRGVYPESGDVIGFYDQFFEINNTNEVQIWAGQTEYNHQVFCDAHLMRKVPTQLQRPIK